MTLLFSFRIIESKNPGKNKVISEYTRLLESDSIDEKLRRECKIGITKAKEELKGNEDDSRDHVQRSASARQRSIDVFLHRHKDYKLRFTGHANCETDIKVKFFLVFWFYLK